MKPHSIFLVLLLVFIFSASGQISAQAQSATSTQAATSTAAVIPAPVVSPAVETGEPEWGTDTVRQGYIWKQAANLIRSGVSKLAAVADPNLPIPVLFGVAPANLTPNFGDPRGSSRTHEGLDIMAPRGVPVVSPTAAVVLSVAWGADSGNYVSTANPGGETFVYMHLDSAAKLSSGDVLSPGSLIGYVGNTGNAAGGATHLHFEIRKNGPTDPYPRLTRAFSPAEKMSFLANILAQNSDRAGLAKLLVAAFPAEFAAAQAAKVVLPQEINSQLAQVAAAGADGSLWSGLGVGSRGSAVATLQNFLILQNKGPAAAKLATAGATGYFGPITRDALAEYQTIANVSAPVKLTRTQILAEIARIQALILSLQQQLKQLQAT